MNPETAKIIDRLVTSRDGLRKLDIADYAMIWAAREAMADAANALTNYAKTIAVIEQTDQAAAPHMLPAPEGVSEAEKTLANILSDPTYDGSTIHFSCEDAASLLSALSSERERAERAWKVADDNDLQWHRLLMGHKARADRAEFLLALALECARENKERAPMFGVAEGVYAAAVRRGDQQKARAQAAEAKVKEAGEVIAPFAATAAQLETKPKDEAVWAGQQPAPPITFGHLRAALRWTQGEGE